jgi:hypothetical protein
MTTTKTYLVTNTLETKFPIDFICSRNRKWIVLQNCRCVYKNLYNNDYLTADVRVHCDFIERNHYLDSFACFTNTQLTKYKKWEIASPRQTFKVWFTDMDGNPIKVKTKAEEEVEERKRQLQAFYEEEMRKRYGDEPEAPQTFIPEPEDNETVYISAFTLELMLIY